jgi:hypothetical protein
MPKPEEEVIAYCRENHTICPQPDRWNELWKMLPAEKRDGEDQRAPLPLILAAWWHTPAMLKMLRLAEHIQWAERHNSLEQVAQFLRSLKEEDWRHIHE